MDLYRNQERELKLARKPLIVLEDELWQINQLSRLQKISEIVRRDWRKLSQSRD